MDGCYPDELRVGIYDYAAGSATRGSISVPTIGMHRTSNSNLNRPQNIWAGSATQ